MNTNQVWKDEDQEWQKKLLGRCKIKIDFPLKEYQLVGLEKAIDTLTVREQDIIDLYFMTGWTQKAIAELYEVPVNRIFRILEAICKKLNQPSRLNLILFGVDCDELDGKIYILEKERTKLEEQLAELYRQREDIRKRLKQEV